MEIIAVEIVTLIFTSLIGLGAPGILSAVLLLGFGFLGKAYFDLNREHREVITNLQELRIGDLKAMSAEYNSLSRDQIKALDQLAKVIGRV